jgi:hypothetical protein
MRDSTEKAPSSAPAASTFDAKSPIYQLAVFWELCDTPPHRLDERLKNQRCSKAARQDPKNRETDSASYRAAACSALEMWLEERDPFIKDRLMKVALANTELANAIDRERAAGSPATPRT